MKSAKVQVLHSKLGANTKEMEAVSDPNMMIMEFAEHQTNSFLACIDIAFNQHFGLVLKPSDIWLLILQAVALHVAEHSEDLRKEYVMHEGKKELIVHVSNSFYPGNPNNDWQGIINQFSAQIDKNTVANTVPLLDNSFSTADVVDQIAAKVTIMDICQSYFQYTMQCMCGFPSITLKGSKQDWQKLKQKFNSLCNDGKVTPEFGLQWHQALDPILQQFINVYDGHIDCLFWNSMFQRGASYGSGGPPAHRVSGWMNALFPYLNAHRGYGSKQDTKKVSVALNSCLAPYEMTNNYVKAGIGRTGDSNEPKQYPTGVASAPVKWKDDSGTVTLQDFTFAAGFVGVAQDPQTLALSPKVAWFIAK